MIPYLDRDFIRAFFLTFLTIVAFVLIGYFVSVLLEQYRFAFGEGGAKFKWVLFYFLITIPRQAAYTIPVGTAIAILWVYTTKARQNELLAYLVGGVSPLRLAQPLLLTAAVLSIVCYFNIEFLAIPGDHLGNKVERVNIQGRSEETVMGERNVFQKGKGNRFFNIKSFDPSKDQMVGPTIIDMGDDWNTPKWRLDAAKATKVGDDANALWYFDDVSFRTFNADGTVESYRTGDRLSEKELGVALEATLTEYLRQRIRPTEMGMGELASYISLFREQGKPTYRLQSHLYFNFAIPFGTFVLALLMCGHILRPSSAGVVVSFGGGLVLLAAYYVITIGFRQMAIYGHFPPLLAAVLPNVGFLALGLYLLHRDRAL